MNRRVIARLDIKGPNLVKGIHLEGLRALGSPDQFAEYYYIEGADELFYMDVVASLYGRNSLLNMITSLAENVFIPLTVGGGIRSIEDITAALRAGADKVCINTAAIKNPNFIKEAAQKFGSSTIVVAIEAIKQSQGNYLAFTDNGREFTGVEVLTWAKKVEELGAGEIVITSVDREGTGKGFDLELTKLISDNVQIPVIAHGGAGNAEQVVSMFKTTNAPAVAISSILHYQFLEHALDTSDLAKEGNFDFFKSKRTFLNIKPSRISEIKKAMVLNGISCRHEVST